VVPREGFLVRFLLKTQTDSSRVYVSKCERKAVNQPRFANFSRDWSGSLLAGHSARRAGKASPHLAVRQTKCLLRIQSHTFGEKI
jgi:hypothetical protein